MAPLKKTSLVDQLYDQLKTKIINLSYPMGSKLNVNELQTVYKVSSTPIREAMNRLQVEGLITYESNIGARVVDLNVQDIVEVQDLALALHSTAVRFAMQRGDHQKIAAEISRYVKGYEGAKTIDAKVKNVFDLIGTFYRHCGNNRLDVNMKVIQGQQLILRYMYFAYRGLEDSKKSHYGLVPEAVLAGDTERVIRILTDSYNEATPVLIEALSQQKAVS